MALLFGSKIDQSSTGGTVTTVGKYKIHTFNTPGANTFIPGNSTKFIDILLVGGGGGAGGWPSVFNGSGGGGAGATLFRKFIPVTPGAPYPVVVGSGGPTAGSSRGTTGSTTIAFGNSAAGGGGGGVWNNSPNVPLDGESAPLASGGGSVGPGPVDIPSGANIYGVGYPGGRNTGIGGQGGGGGGAGGAGQAGPTEGGPGAGGPGIPIVYFTFNPADINISKGGAGYSTPATPTAGGGGYGSGGYVTGTTPTAPATGRPGAAYIRYRDWSL
jgi:hypothetical protein